MSDNQLNNALDELNHAEQSIIRLMKVAEETIHELKQIPTCDYERVDELSKEYLSNLQSVRSKVLNHTHLISSNTSASLSNPASSSTTVISYSINNYSLKKEIEISKSYSEDIEK